MSGDTKIKAATQEILEVMRKYDLSGYFLIMGRNLVEVRTRYASWSCYEQVPCPGGSMVHFRTRRGGAGERRSDQDIDDSSNIARAFAMELGKAAEVSESMWKALLKQGAEAVYDEFRGEPPPRDFQ